MHPFNDLFFCFEKCYTIWYIDPALILSLYLSSDILNIQSWPKELNNLSVFSSLTTIQGRSLYK